jgi:hypothetical protein
VEQKSEKLILIDAVQIDSQFVWLFFFKSVNPYTGMHPLKHRFNFIIQIPMVYAYWSIQLSQNTTFLLVQQTYAHILLWRIFFYDYKCKISLELWAVNVTYLCTNSMLRKDTRRDAVCISVLPSPSFSINIALQPSIICEITYFCDCLWVSFQVLLLG